MRRLAIGLILGVLTAVLATAGWAQVNATRAVDADKPPAAAPAATSTAAEAPAPATPPAATKTAPVVTTPRDRMAAVLEKQMAAAEKLLKGHDDEMAKPEKERDVRKALGLKLGAAQAYLKVSQAAKNDATQLKKDDQSGFLDQYEKPNREKAINLYLELAGKAKDLKDYANAVSLYRGVLAIDPQNAAAQAALKAINEELKTASLNRTTTGSSTGGSNQVNQNTKQWQTWKHDYTGYGSWHTWGGYGW